MLNYCSETEELNPGSLLLALALVSPCLFCEVVVMVLQRKMFGMEGREAEVSLHSQGEDTASQPATFILRGNVKSSSVHSQGNEWCSGAPGSLGKGKHWPCWGRHEWFALQFSYRLLLEA